MKTSPARLAAFEILTKIENDKAFSANLLPIYEANLAVKDRALCHALTLGVLRRQIYLDAIIESLTKKKIEKFDAAVKIALRIGLFQLLFLDKIPAHAAINESVNLVIKAKKTSAKNLVNAVLRRVSRNEFELKFSDDIERMAVETSHPRWLIDKWIAQFGASETAKLAHADNETPALAFRLTNKSNDKTIAVLQKIGLEVVPSEIVENGWTVSGSNDVLQLYAAEGKIYFQDEASQLVAQTVKLNDGAKFLDVCAAPGSKTTYVASEKLKVRSGKLIVAGDFYEHRVRNLQENCRKQAAEFVEIVRYDAEKNLPFAGASFDVVLVDAPCSGTGTIRHNPEIRYFLQPENFAELTAKQLRLLQNASKVIKPFGTLIYSTCSLEPEENEAVAEKFLIDNADFVKAAPPLAERFLTAENFARTFPHIDRTDGFFVAVFEKRG